MPHLSCLWNEQTEIVQVLLPEFVEAHPEVFLWYEIKEGVDIFIEGGAIVARWACYAWLGCPRDTTVETYVNTFGLESIN